MFRALTFIKRVGNLEKARAEIETALQGMANRSSEDNSLHEGWLRNVYALTYFQEKKFEPAMHQEKLAMKCVGELHDPSATHLKINLISNVSVLQESAKKFSDAITTWRRFEKISANWGANFLKHHSYRLGGLLLKAGQRDEGVSHYVAALASARSLGDPFHTQAISAELGRQALTDGNRAEATLRFEEALDTAKRVGDPLRIAQSMAGLSLAGGDVSLGDAQRLAGETSTYADEARQLVNAIASADQKTIEAALPAPRSKLNRPFDLVNL
jgi:tetratricopeptide (TPR) repeat protein